MPVSSPWLPGAAAHRWKVPSSLAEKTRLYAALGLPGEWKRSKEQGGAHSKPPRTPARWRRAEQTAGVLPGRRVRGQPAGEVYSDLLWAPTRLAASRSAPGHVFRRVSSPGGDADHAMRLIPALRNQPGVSIHDHESVSPEASRSSMGADYPARKLL